MSNTSTNAPFIECCEAKWMHFIFPGPFLPDFHSLWVRDHSKWTKQWKSRRSWTANRKQFSRSQICLSFRKKRWIVRPSSNLVCIAKMLCCAKKGVRKHKIPVNRFVCKSFSNFFVQRPSNDFRGSFGQYSTPLSFPWYSSNMAVGFQLILE